MPTLTMFPVPTVMCTTANITSTCFPHAMSIATPSISPVPGALTAITPTS